MEKASRRKVVLRKPKVNIHKNPFLHVVVTVKKFSVFGKEFYPIRSMGWTFFCVIFVRDIERKDFQISYLNHERIHVAQMWDMWFIFAYLLYSVEFLIKLPLYGFRPKKAYRNISFEREAYANQDDFTYVFLRNKFSHFFYF